MCIVAIKIEDMYKRVRNNLLLNFLYTIHKGEKVINLDFGLLWIS